MWTMITMSPHNDPLFLYGNRQMEHIPPIALYPVIELNKTAKERKDFLSYKLNKLNFSENKSIISEKVVQLTLTEITGKGRFVNEQV